MTALPSKESRILEASIFRVIITEVHPYAAMLSFNPFPDMDLGREHSLIVGKMSAVLRVIGVISFRITPLTLVHQIAT
jgi:hypothetical protein